MSEGHGEPARLDEAALDGLLGAAFEDEGASDVRPSAPTVLCADRYRDFRTVGTGGMGIVFLALDTELHREVAVKVVLPPAATKKRYDTPTPFEVLPPDEKSEAAEAYRDLCDRFLQEAWLTSALEHPGIVPVHEVGRTPRGVPYYTMRYVRGVRTLEEELVGTATARQRLELLDPFLHVCDAIRYAHSRGVIHRDLKPSNIGLGEFGEVVVLDWGLSKARDEPGSADSVWQERIRDFRAARDMHTVATALGTPGYMSPEAALGDMRSVDERSDVYSLGAILYRILTGKLPFEFDGYLELLQRLREDRPAPASAVDPSVPEGLSRICAKALSRSREDRYPGAGRLAAAIRDQQRQSRIRSEIRGLMREAEAAFELAQELAGEPLLRRVDQVRALCLRVLEHRNRHARARRLLSESDRLRHEADRAREHAIQTAAERERLAALERERARSRTTLRRVAAVVLLLFAVGTSAAAWVFDGKRREARIAEARAFRVLEELGIVQSELGTTQDELDEAMAKARSERDARADEQDRVGQLEAELDASREQTREERSARTRAEELLTRERMQSEAALRSAESAARSDLDNLAGEKGTVQARLESLEEVHSGVVADLRSEREARKAAELKVVRSTAEIRRAQADLDKERELRRFAEARANRAEAKIERELPPRPEMRSPLWVDLEVDLASGQEPLAKLLRESTSRNRPSVVWIRDARDDGLARKVDIQVLADERVELSLKVFSLQRVDVRALTEGPLREEASKQLGFHFLDPAGEPAAEPVMGKRVASLSAFTGSLDRVWEASFSLPFRTYRAGMGKILDRLDILSARVTILTHRRQKLDMPSNHPLVKRVNAEMAEIRVKMTQLAKEEEAVLESCELNPEFRPK